MEQSRVPGDGTKTPDSGTGWLTFAAVLIGLVGIFNLIWGISALANDDYFVADELLFGDLSLWGTIHLVIGAIQIIVAFLIASRNPVGAAIGIFFAALNAIGALLAIGAYPLWSVIILVIDGLIIYGLSVYGFDDAPTS